MCNDDRSNSALRLIQAEKVPTENKIGVKTSLTAVGLSRYSCNVSDEDDNTYMSASVQDEEKYMPIIGQSDFNKLPEIANYSASRNKRRADSLTLQGDMYTMDSTPRQEGIFQAARTHTDLKN